MWSYMESKIGGFEFMKKKIIVLLLGVTFILSACGGAEDSEAISTEKNDSEAVSEMTTEGDISDLDAIGDIEVEENLFSVELTIPADYVGDTTQEELDVMAEENGFKSITLNEDGSATYIMTKAQHKEMMEEMAANINTSLAEMIGSEEYPNFTAIEANEDFTEFTITTASTELDLAESFSVIGFYMYGGMYNIFNGTPVGNIHVDFINADSGEIISSSDSSSMGE